MLKVTVILCAESRISIQYFHKWRQLPPETYLMKTIFSLLAFLLLLSPTSYAQIAETVVIRSPDTTANWYSGKIIPSKKFRAVSFVVPAALISYGFVAVYNHGALRELDLSTKAELQEDHPLFAAHVDNYLQYAPAAAVYALNFSGIKGKHNLFDASMLYVTSTMITGLSTHFVKKGVGRIRPNGAADAFPSGHTATAFASAEFLYQEYKDVSPWIGYSGYIVAAATGTLRLYNNKHWVSDVVAGAGFGIASTKLSYLLYPHIKKLFSSKNKDNLMVAPMVGQGTRGFTLIDRF